MDIVQDVGNLVDIKSKTVTHIVASHVLEHFPHPETVRVLGEWFRVLAPSGNLYVAVPDFERAMDLYRMVGFNRWLEEFVVGGQEYETAFHYALFTESKLRDLLDYVGFKDIKRVEALPVHAVGDCSSLVSKYDNKRISLNMTAVKP